MGVSWSEAAAVPGACRCRCGGMTSSLGPESLQHTRFAVVDVETTGVRAQRGGRILEVAVAILEGGTIHLAFDALLDPGTAIPPWVARLTGITDGLVVGRPRFGDIVAGLGRALDAGVFGAHNPARHRAFGDALATAHILRALIGRARDRGVETLEQLIELHDRPRHAKTRNAEVGTRNSSECVPERASPTDCSAFRVPRSDF